MLELMALALECAPTVEPQTMLAIVQVESGNNPYAIGIVGGRLTRQPKTKEEALATAKQLAEDDWNFSLGLAQINRHNLYKYEISYEQAFDACTNLNVGSKILEDCYVRAAKQAKEPQAALQAALSCYYSGNFTRGFKPDVIGAPSYVQKVLTSAEKQAQAIPVVPSIKESGDLKPQIDKAGGDTSPIMLKPQATQPVTLPSDHAPILVSPKNETPDDKASPGSSTIVF